MPERLHITRRDASPLVVLDLAGELATADQALGQAAQQATQQGARHLLLHFAGVDYINSLGIASVFQILLAARAVGQQVFVTGLTPHYQKIFHLMGLDRHLQVVATEDAARASVQDGATP